MSEWLGLTGKRVLVAGAGGLGGACATAFADAGASVIAADIQARELPGVRTVAADMSTSDGCRELVDSAATKLGGLDVLVHSVGQNIRKPVLETSDEEWQSILNLNLSTVFWLGKAAGKLMCAQGYGRQVHLSSVAGLLAHPAHGPYAASKGGLNQIVRVMAREWASSGVTVNAVAPGYTETPLTEEHLAKPGVRDELTGLVPAGKLGSVSDVVGPILFLASDQASFVTGHVLYVDGGRTLV
ncbi:glucose 1-dehydrogenase [Tamaricihabitans halophyticus]|uniref:Glucose 1-dehydrogenase n=1 Tax=Tamaricihabitans halophyticus TaxID=1262583 RepID=A0A4R2QTE1_9PSEU|nr:SDR family oxidoreductase [Tamaricihabitans halophyticus]TCP51978.1 glucose 1-dehydrogenase [Tamaricihabitans halophyticus]